MTRWSTDTPVTSDEEEAVMTRSNIYIPQVVRLACDVLS